MERVLAVKNLKQLEKHFSTEFSNSTSFSNSTDFSNSQDFSRIYFGAETCERKIPSLDKVKKAKKLCEQNNAYFSLLTPFVTDAGLKKLESVFLILSPEDEIIANDFGVLFKAAKYKAIPVAGRLLNKQFRDPRISSFAGMPKELLSHLSLSQADNPNFRKLLSGFGVKRFELDNLLQGIGTKLSGTGFSASLYFPFVFISATRFCLLANCGKLSTIKKIGVFACSKECEKFSFRLSNASFPTQLLLSENALFFENKNMPSEKELSSIGVDRIIHNSALMQSVQ